MDFKSLIFKDNLSKKDRQKVFKGVVKGFKKKSVAEDGEASVFPFGKDRVVRVACAQRDAQYDDSGYHAWVSKVVLKTKSKAVPKVHFHAIFDLDQEDKILVTVMEKLKHDFSVAEVISDDFSEHDQKFGYYSGNHYKVPKKYYQRLNRVMKKAQNLVYCGDVHANNIMFRKNGDPVLTDPSY